MKYRLFAVLVLSILILNLGASTFADTKVRKSGGSELAALLPASDGVMTFDVKRFLGDALPKLLASNQPMLAKITGEMDKMKEKVGIDVRQFDYVAAGVTARKIAEKKYDIDPVLIARSQMSSASLIGAAKLASNGKYTEERVGDRTIYVFSIVSDKPGAHKLTDKVAVTALDSVTIAFGDLDRVRQTIQSKTRVSSELLGLLDRSPAAVSSFAARVPAGMSAFVPLDNDELGKSVDSIQLIYGNADVLGDSASFHVTARTLQNAQAASLHETLEGLQIIGKAFLGGNKDADKQVFARMIDNVKFSVKANEVSLDLTVPQSDIGILVGKLQ
jgi:hypothetical protein